MIGIPIATVTVILLAMIAVRRLSPEFRRRVEEPKYRFLANLGTITNSNSPGEDKCHQSQDEP